MDLEEESSKSELEELDDGEKTENLEKTPHSDEIEVGTNGDVGNDPPIETDHNDVPIEDAEPIEAAEENGEGIGEDRTGKSPSGSIGSPDPEADSSKPAKGHGLKKWRRIRRDSSKDSNAGADYSVILKRRLPLFETPKVREVSKQKSDGEDEEPISPIELRNPPSVPIEIASGVLDPEIGLLVASSGFSVGVDSDNSEERSSKSSTATSAPRMRHELFGFGRERNRPRGFGGRGSGHAAQQRAQRGRGGGADASKKLRGDRLRLEKENSHSSSESDLRSTNAVSARWGGTDSSNGKQVNVDGEHSDEDQTYEGTIYKENGRVGDSTIEVLGADTLDEENLGKNKYEPHEDLDSFSQSIVLLQAAQEALEKEIEQIREIGKEPMLEENCNGPVEAFEEASSPVLGVHFLELTQKIEHLEHKLKEASATIDAKESIISNLEAIIDRTRRSNGHDESELEFDGLFKKKMEAEVEFLITSRATQNWKSEEQTALYEEQKSLVEDQAKMAMKLRNTEDNAIVLMMQAQELEAEVLEVEEALKLRSKVCKISLCCFAQSAMLFVALWCFIVQLFPLSEGMAPT